MILLLYNWRMRRTHDRTTLLFKLLDKLHLFRRCDIAAVFPGVVSQALERPHFLFLWIIRRTGAYGRDWNIEIRCWGFGPPESPTTVRLLLFLTFGFVASCPRGRIVCWGWSMRSQELAQSVKSN